MDILHLFLGVLLLILTSSLAQETDIIWFPVDDVDGMFVSSYGERYRTSWGSRKARYTEDYDSPRMGKQMNQISKQPEIDIHSHSRDILRKLSKVSKSRRNVPETPPEEIKRVNSIPISKYRFFALKPTENLPIRNGITEVRRETKPAEMVATSIDGAPEIRREQLPIEQLPSRISGVTENRRRKKPVVESQPRKPERRTSKPNRNRRPTTDNPRIEEEDKTIRIPHWSTYERPSANERRLLEELFNLILNRPESTGSQNEWQDRNDRIETDKENQESETPDKLVFPDNEDNDSGNVDSSSSTTEGPQNGANFERCVRSCLVTNEFNPVCGTDLNNYNNIGKLKCAKNCGIRVEFLHHGSCGRGRVAVPAIPLPEAPAEDSEEQAEETS